MICDCGATGSQRHRTWCATRLPEAEEAYLHALRNALWFYGFVFACLLWAGWRSEIAGWWREWGTVIGWSMVYGLPVAGLLAVAYGRQLLAWWRR